jgi:hypothetical protein
MGGERVRPAIFWFVPALQESTISLLNDIIGIQIVLTKELNSSRKILTAFSMK